MLYANEKKTWCLTWGILYHMLGVDNRAKECLEIARSLPEPDSKIAEAILRYLIEPNSQALVEIVISTSRYLNHKRSIQIDLASEPVNNYKKFSRDPFAKISPDDSDRIALVVACYLLRGYALFFCRPRDQRDFNAGKIALNDMNQAHQLSWRLYNSLNENHRNQIENGYELYLDNVIRSSRDEIPHASPGSSPYFIWSARSVCEIMRGNIYRQIDYMKPSERYYSHALDRFRRLIHHCRMAKCRKQNESPPAAEEIDELAKSFLTPTFVKAIAELSKVQFDLGKLLKSLATAVNCLEFTISLSPVKTEQSGDVNVKQKIRKGLRTVAEFLDSDRILPAHDRETISLRFGDPHPCENPVYPYEVKAGEEKKRLRKTKTFLVALCTCVRPDMSKLVVETMARIGFTLYSLARQSSPKPECVSVREKWFRFYFRFDLIWNEKFPAEAHGTVQVEPSDLGRYCETMLRRDAGKGGKDGSEEEDFSRIDQDIFPDKVERKYALLLRQHIEDDVDEVSPTLERLTESQFYKEVLAATTRNIANIVTIPRRNRRVLMRRGYVYRRTQGDLSEASVSGGLCKVLGLKYDDPDPAPASEAKALGKFVVLRRWQSFNPKIPRAPGMVVPGGGYYLCWRGKGIVIDPGYDFIQNFYDEGFSIEDIDAIVVTHSHPDHDDDLSSLITLVREWNDYYESLGLAERVKNLDLFLNESAHWKFAPWLQASSVKLGRVISLPTLYWDKDTEMSSDGPIRGKNVRIDLREHSDAVSRGNKPYHMVIEVTPAWHDDVIGKTAAIGIKFHLYKDDPDAADTADTVLAAIIGYTSDTGEYGFVINEDDPTAGVLRVDREYEDCDVLVAHLGDIRIRELASAIEGRGESTWHSKKRQDPLWTLLQNWFKSTADSEFTSRVRSFLHFVITLNLVPAEALDAKLTGHCGIKSQKVQDWLGKYLSLGIAQEDRHGTIIEFSTNKNDRVLEDLFRTVVEQMHKNVKVPVAVQNSISYQLDEAYHIASELHARKELNQQAFLLLAFLVVCSRWPWQYQYHLGVYGIYKLFQGMVNYCKNQGVSSDKVLIIGELPEELTSYRQSIARLLNRTEINSRQKTGGQWVHAFTGDIGLHIGLFTHGKEDNVSKKLTPRIRCTYCNYNNEIVCGQENYHAPKSIRELSIKRLQTAMIYLCTSRGHCSEDADRPEYFLSRPELRVI